MNLARLPVLAKSTWQPFKRQININASQHVFLSQGGNNKRHETFFSPLVENILNENELDLANFSLEVEKKKYSHKYGF